MRIHRTKLAKCEDDCVVNCFQNTNFSEDSQDYTIKLGKVDGCELLSEY